MYRPRTEEVTDRNTSQFLDGSFGLLSSHDGGIPVYFSIVLTPDCLVGCAWGAEDVSVDGVDIDSR